MINRFLHTILILSLLSCLLILPGSLLSQGQDEKSKQKLEYAAGEIFQRSKEYAENGSYRKAVLDLILILDYYPSYKNIDQVYCELGNYLTEMQLYKAAEQVYKNLIKQKIESPYVPIAIYGLERLYYEQKKYNRVIDYFYILREKFPNAQLDEGIYYYAGQSFFFQGDFDNAISTFDAIEEDSEFWGFGLYTRALANFKKKMLMMPFRI